MDPGHAYEELSGLDWLKSIENTHFGWTVPWTGDPGTVR